MLDKIIIHSDKRQASLIFLDKPPVVLSSDTDVVPLLLLFIGCPNVKVTHSTTDTLVIELRRDSSHEITLKIFDKEVA